MKHVKGLEYSISMSEITPPAEEAREPIILPREVIRPLGKALNVVAMPQLDIINTNLSSMTVTTDFLDDMRLGATRVEEIFNKLARARTVTLSPFSSNGYEFKFSEETDDEPSKPGVVVMEAETTDAFVEALNHEVNNKLALVTVYSKLMISDNGSEPIVARANTISTAGDKIATLVSSFVDAEKIEITTHEDGTVTYDVIKKPAEAITP